MNLMMDNLQLCTRTNFRHSPFLAFIFELWLVEGFRSFLLFILQKCNYDDVFLLVKVYTHLNAAVVFYLRNLLIRGDEGWLPSFCCDYNLECLFGPVVTLRIRENQYFHREKIICEMY